MQNIISWLPIILPFAAGSIAIAVFWKRLWWSYHCLMVMIEYRTYPGVKSILILITLIGGWTIVGAVGLLTTFCSAYWGYWPYWPTQLCQWIWVLGGITLLLFWAQYLTPSEEDITTDDKAFEISCEMRDALRRRLGRPIKRRRTT